VQELCSIPEKREEFVTNGGGDESQQTFKILNRTGDEAGCPIQRNNNQTFVQLGKMRDNTGRKCIQPNPRGGCGVP
jgi:hypothetical protein